MSTEALLEYRFLHNKLQLAKVKILSQGCWKIGYNIFYYILTLLQKQIQVYTTIILEIHFEKLEYNRLYRV